MTNKPITVLIEGCNNSGKGTVLKALKKRLLENGMVYLELSQPYLVENRSVLLSGELDYREEYSVFKKDRAYVHDMINLIIKDNKVDVILLDRSIVSSFCYQSIMHNDYEMLIEITKDASQLYEKLTIDIGLHLEAEPEIIAQRNYDSDKLDYRDSSDLDEIRKELWAYNIAWSTFLSLGCVKHYMIFDNNNYSDLNNIIRKTDSLITEMLKTN